MIAQTDPLIVVLDTCVLAPMPLCDTLLRLAEDPAFYMPRWSAGAHAILSENVKHFPGESLNPYKIDVLTPTSSWRTTSISTGDYWKRNSAGRRPRGFPYEALVQKLAKWAPSLPKLLMEMP